MGQFVRGDVLVLSFPFSDLSQTKRRPTLVLATLQGDDVILCQITSQARSDVYSVTLDRTDFTAGGLKTKAVGFGRIGFLRRMKEWSYTALGTFPM